MEPYATIVISYRRPDLLATVLERLSRQSTPPSRVIVVDNAGDLSDDVVTGSPLAPRTSLLRRADNPGYGAAVNAARDAVRTEGLERLLVLTHDADFEDDFAQTALQTLAETAAGAVAPVLYWSDDRSRVFSAGGVLTRTGRAWNSTTARDLAAYEVDWVDGAIVMYAVAALDAIDWLDPDYFLYFEDVDTAWRMRARGWKTVIQPACAAYQQPGNHPMYLGIRNMVRFARKSEVPPLWSAIGVLRRVGEEATYRLLHGRRTDIRDAFRGWRDGRRGMSGKPPIGTA